MGKYKVEGWIKVPVDVEIEADNSTDACIYAHEAVMDEFPRGTSISISGNIEYQFAGEEEKVIIAACEEYEYEFNTAEEIK